MSKLINCYIHAIRFLYGAFIVKFDSFSEPKNDELWQYTFWLRHLIGLVNFDSPDQRILEYGHKMISDLEPSEVSFLSDLRKQVLQIYDFNLSQERLIYKTLLKLLK